jgi:vancomycin resistance protein VanW
MKLKNLIPKLLRRHLQISCRYWRDKKDKCIFAQKRAITVPFLYKHIFKQTILHADSNRGKVENMRLAGQAISLVQIEPNEILSFWHIVGNPSAKRGFFKSRNLVNGVLQEDYGGGLCQVSGILYWAALSVGLEVLERHSHSIDIYTEEERFVPLGADATVVYGYKDVRLRNNLATSIHFHIHVAQNQLVCELGSQAPLSISDLDFQRQDYPDKRIVQTRQRLSSDTKWHVLNTSEYRVMDRSHLANTLS